MAGLALFAVLLAGVFGVEVGGLRATQNINSEKSAKKFVRALEFQRRLRVCNAYPYPTALDIFRGEEKLTAEKPMAYKGCEDFKIQLTPGDKLIFKIGNANAGTFSVSDLPNNDAILLLIIYRHDTLSTAVSFESHVYANLLNAQVAVVDTYKGAKKAALRIQDHTDAKTSRAEELLFDSVVAVNEGKYDVVLVSGTETVGEDTLIALNRESYIVMRTGVEAQQGTSYPQELVIFPHSDSSHLFGNAPAAMLGLVIALLAMH